MHQYVDLSFLCRRDVCVGHQYTRELSPQCSQGQYPAGKVHVNSRELAWTALLHKNMRFCARKRARVEQERLREITRRAIITAGAC